MEGVEHKQEVREQWAAKGPQERAGGPHRGRQRVRFQVREGREFTRQQGLEAVGAPLNSGWRKQRC